MIMPHAAANGATTQPADTTGPTVSASANGVDTQQPALLPPPPSSPSWVRGGVAVVAPAAASNSNITPGRAAPPSPTLSSRPATAPAVSPLAARRSSNSSSTWQKAIVGGGGSPAVNSGLNAESSTTGPVTVTNITPIIQNGGGSSVVLSAPPSPPHSPSVPRVDDASANGVLALPPLNSVTHDMNNTATTTTDNGTGSNAPGANSSSMSSGVVVPRQPVLRQSSPTGNIPGMSLGVAKARTKIELRIALTGDVDITARALLMNFATGLCLFSEEKPDCRKLEVVSKTLALESGPVTLEINLYPRNQPPLNPPQIGIYVFSMLDRTSFVHLNDRLQITQRLYGHKCRILLCIIDHDMVSEWCSGNKSLVHNRLKRMDLNSRVIERGAGPVFPDELADWLKGETSSASFFRATATREPVPGNTSTGSGFVIPPQFSPTSSEVSCWAVRSVPIEDRNAVKHLFEDVVVTFTTQKKRGTNWKQMLPCLPQSVLSQLPYQQFHLSKNKFVDETYHYLDELIHVAIKKGHSLDTLLLYLHDEDVLFDIQCFTILMAHFPKARSNWLKHLSPTHQLLYGKAIESMSVAFTERPLPGTLPSSSTVCLNFMMLPRLSNTFEQSILSRMTAITDINLSHNILTEVPGELFKLKTLRALNLSWNLITCIPEIVSPPPRFQEFNVEHNDITELPESLGDCLFMNLNCSNNKISILPHSFSHHLRTGRLIYQPGNNFLPTLNTVDDFLRDCEQRASLSLSVRWPKIKLALIGPENVGKTTLLRRLQGKPHDGSVTEGIVIQDIKLRDVNFSCWDFGGQDSFLPTHQFFLTGRALYLVFFDLLNPDSHRTEYWLRFSQNPIFSNSARQLAHTVQKPPFPPVLLVGTRLDKLPRDKARDICSGLYAQFRHICVPIGCIPLDVRGGELSELESMICATVIEKQAFLQEKVPGSWLTLDSLLNEKKSLKQTVNWSEFCALASTARVEPNQTKKVASFLHDIGSVVYYDSKDSNLGEYVVLNPKYLSDVMVTMVNIKSDTVSNGFLPLERLQQIWHSYDPEIHPLLIELLSLFLILYPISINGQVGYIVPCSLSSNEPPEAVQIWPNMKDEKLQTYERLYVFPIVPIGLFERLLLRVLHLHNIVRHCFWHNNMRLEVAPQCDARNQFGSIVFESTFGYTPFLVLTVRTPVDSKPYLLTKLLECIETTIDCFYRNLQLGMKQLVTCPHCPDPTSNPEAPLPHQFPLDEIVAAIGSRSTVTCKVENIAIRPHTLVPDLTLETQFHISPADLIDMVQIGSGGFGKIYKALLDGREVAVKELIVKSEEDEVLEKLLEFKKEVMLMSMLDNPFIVKLYGICVSPPMMIMEFVVMGDLFKILHKKAEVEMPISEFPFSMSSRLDAIPKLDSSYAHPMSWRLRLQLALDIAQGLDYLHSLHPPVVHRDLRSPNIFVKTLDPSAPVRAKVADFGLSVTAAGKVSGNLATWQWLAPEVIDSSNSYDERSDIFSFGIVFYEIITRQFPYDEYAENDLYSIKKGNKWEWRQQSMKVAIMNGLRPTLPDSFPIPSVTNLIKQCWLSNPSERPNTRSIVEGLRTVLGKGEEITKPKRVIAPLAEQPKLLWEFMSEMKIWSSASDSVTDTLWVGCADGTIRKLDSVHGCFMGSLSALSQRCRIYCLLYIPAPTTESGHGSTVGEVWAGTEYGKIAIFDALKSRFKCHVHAHGEKHIISSMVAIMQPSNETDARDVRSVWSVSSTEATIVMIHPQTKYILNKVSFNPAEIRIISMCQCLGHVWVGCYKKIIILDATTMGTHRVLTRNILPSKYICPVSVDDSHVWFGAAKKICVFSSTEMICVAQLAGHSCEVTTLCTALGYVWSSDIEGAIFAWHPETFVVVKKFGQTGVSYSTLFFTKNKLIYATVHPAIVVGAYQCRASVSQGTGEEKVTATTGRSVRERSKSSTASTANTWVSSVDTTPVSWKSSKLNTYLTIRPSKRGAGSDPPSSLSPSPSPQPTSPPRPLPSSHNSPPPQEHSPESHRAPISSSSPLLLSTSHSTPHPQESTSLIPGKSAPIPIVSKSSSPNRIHHQQQQSPLSTSLPTTATTSTTITSSPSSPLCHQLSLDSTGTASSSTTTFTESSLGDSVDDEGIVSSPNSDYTDTDKHSP
ncbi:leucinerich repeat kinase [Pelomyxa schiedti]|nr:leucinerich repeat kinase [Pelomyxa schiedti]